MTSLSRGKTLPSHQQIVFGLLTVSLVSCVQTKQWDGTGQRRLLPTQEKLSRSAAHDSVITYGPNVHPYSNSLRQLDARANLPEAKAVEIAPELQCPPCDRVFCSSKRSQNLKCRGGFTVGVCNCCTVCAKVEDERCGGPWDYLGKCDRGLYCEADKNVLHATEGRCRKKAEPHDWKELNQHMPKDQPLVAGGGATCKPRCTADFCMKRPKAMCSAAHLDNSDDIGSRTCRGECQHTSCQACRFVDPAGLACGKCSQNDYMCIRSFGQCIRKTFCQADHFPCSYGNANSHVGIFKCIVPQCP